MFFIADKTTNLIMARCDGWDIETQKRLEREVELDGYVILEREITLSGNMVCWVCAE